MRLGQVIVKAWEIGFLLYKDNFLLRNYEKIRTDSYNNNFVIY